MAKMVKYALIGATIGAGYSAVQAYRRDEPMDVLASQAAKVGAEAALAGAVLGLLVGRRSKSKRARKLDRQIVGDALRAATALEMAHTAKGRARRYRNKAAKQGHMARTYAERAATAAAAKEAAKLSQAALSVMHSAAETALERAADAAEAARPHVEQAARASRVALYSAAESARPHVEQAARATRERALDLTDSARPHVERLAETAHDRAHDLTARALEASAPARNEASAPARNADGPQEIVLQLT